MLMLRVFEKNLSLLVLIFLLGLSTAPLVGAHSTDPVFCSGPFDASVSGDQIRLDERAALSQAMRRDLLSSRTFDVHGNIANYLPQILLEYRLHGRLHIVNTGLKSQAELISLMPSLGFSEGRAFISGGKANASVQSKWLAPNLLRNLDYYPPQLYLLPNIEIQYQKSFPQDVLFYVAQEPAPNSGGRIFLHSVRDIEAAIGAQPDGAALLEKINTHGLALTFGFLDAGLASSGNYMHSWQDAAGVNDIAKAVAIFKNDSARYDEVWQMEVKGEGGKTYHTLMTRTLIPGRVSVGDATFMSVPRLALTSPTLENGYRQFTLGNGETFSEAHEKILLKAFLDTRQGTSIHNGDVLLFNNGKVAHSRESFEATDNPRQIAVAMSGGLLARNLSDHMRDEVSNLYGLTAQHLAPLWDAAPTKKLAVPKAAVVTKLSDARYTFPPMEAQVKEEFSMQIFDLNGKDLRDPAVVASINQEFSKYGRLHIVNNHLPTQELPPEVLDALGFGPKDQFLWGGKASGRTVRSPLGQGFFTVDKYPAHQPLLAHNEILYQRVLPIRMFFHFRKVSGSGRGGRTFVHSAENAERVIREMGAPGLALLGKLRRHGQLIRTGFLDDRHPGKIANFVRSWQDRFDSNDIDQALQNCLAQKSHFDRCYKEELPELSADGQKTFMLMTEITIPMFKTDKRDGKTYMMFPRIAYDSPSVINGFRQFPFGDGTEFSMQDIDMMLQAYWQTREAIYQKPGDFILVDNLRFGHSREPYFSHDKRGEPIPREAGVIMAGEFYTDDEIGKGMEVARTLSVHAGLKLH